MCLAALNKVDIDKAAADIKAARPTAYDLFYAVDWMLAKLKAGEDPVKAADSYADSIVDKCKAIGRFGNELIRDGMTLMTHCNAGALATVDVGTALAPMRAAHDSGKKIFVYASETRPRLQGMQLTAWELNQEGIDHAIIPDGASGHFIRKGVDMIIVGADRIAANRARAQAKAGEDRFFGKPEDPLIGLRRQIGPLMVGASEVVLRYKAEHGEVPTWDEETLRACIAEAKGGEQ
jgi:methylthioribose-1-phosphate isomerase